MRWIGAVAACLALGVALARVLRSRSPTAGDVSVYAEGYGSSR